MGVTAAMEQKDMDTQIVATEMRAGFASLRERMEDQRVASENRHAENVKRLERIEEQCRETNGRVNRHEERIVTLFDRVKELARRLTGHDDGEGDDRHLTVRDVATWAAIAIGAASLAVYALIEIGGYHK